MTEQPGKYNTGSPPPTIATLKAQVHQLVEKVSRHRYGIKLLTNIKGLCEVSLQYKANRKFNRPIKRSREDNL